MTQAEHTLPAEFAPPEAGAEGLGLLRVAWQRKSLLVLGTVAGLVVGALYYAQQPAVYQSTTQVVVIKKSTDAIPLPGMENNPGYTEDYVPTQLAILRSPRIIAKAVEKGQLQSLKSFEGLGDPTGAIAGALSVARDNSTGTSYSTSSVLNLTYRGSVGGDCGVVLATVVDAYKDFLDETYHHSSHDTIALINSAKTLLREDLARSREKYREFRKNSPLVLHGKDGGNLQQDRLSTIDARRSALALQRAEIQARLAAIDEAQKAGRDVTALLETPLESDKPASREGAQNPKTSLEAQLMPLVLEERELIENNGYGPDHPKVVGVRRRMQLLRDLANHQGEALNLPAALTPEAKAKDQIQALERRLENIQLDEQALAKMFAEAHAELRSLSNDEVEEEELRKEIGMTQQLYDGILKRLQEVDLVKDMGGYDCKVISPAGPGSKIGPRATPVFLMALLCGLMAGTGMAWLAEVSDKSFRTPEEIRRRLGLPVVGHIPYLRPDETGDTGAEEDGLSLSPGLCSHYRPKSVEAEAYRGVRTALYFSTQGKGHQVIQVTSPNMGDGKSTLVANLGISIANSGKGILIIDADFRRPTQHKLFGVTAQVGLASVIAGEAELDDALQATAVPNLSVLPCGPHPPNPAELLNSPRFEGLLDLLRKRFEFILVDTPPMLAVSDPAVVTSRVDGVLLTIRASKNGRPAAERTKEMLVTLGANLLGVVVNALGGRGKYDYYHYQYSYNYAYNDGYHEPYYEGADTPRNGDSATASSPSESQGFADGEVDVIPTSTAADKNGRRRTKSTKRNRNGQPRQGLLRWFRGVCGL